MEIKKLLERLSYTLVQGDLNGEVTGLCEDNRKVQPGDLFLCMQGEHFDTHNCVEDIADKGARVIVVEKETSCPEGATIVRVESTRIAASYIAAAYYDYPGEKLVKVAITGTKGKTSTTHILADILRKAGYKTGTIGSNGTNYGTVSLEYSNTTPDPIDIQRYLSDMVDYGCTHFVMEVSSQGEKQHRVDGMEFDYGVWTNIMEGDHISGPEHKDFAEYIYWKAMVLQQCKKNFVFNDNPHTEELLTMVTRPYERYGATSAADYQVTNIQPTFQNDIPGHTFSIRGKMNMDFYVRLAGEYNVWNAAAAAIVAYNMGVSQEAIRATLDTANVLGRNEVIYHGKFTVIVDFAHSGYSQYNHLESLKEYKAKRIVSIVGGYACRTYDRRYGTGKSCGQLADLTIVTSYDNGFASVGQIIDDICTGLTEVNGAYIVIPNRQNAIRYAIENAKEGDIISITGFGPRHVHVREYGDYYNHNDRDFIEQLLKERGLI